MTETDAKPKNKKLLIFKQVEVNKEEENKEQEDTVEDAAEEIDEHVKEIAATNESIEEKADEPNPERTTEQAIDEPKSQIETTIEAPTAPSESSVDILSLLPTYLKKWTTDNLTLTHSNASVYTFTTSDSTPLSVQAIGHLSSSLKTVSVWANPPTATDDSSPEVYNRGVVFYLNEDKIGM
jgi:hypothetical protein